MSNARTYICTLCMQKKEIAKQLVDGLGTYCCKDCGWNLNRFSEAVMPTAVKLAPWSPEQMSSLTAYQRSSLFCSYVCNEGHELFVTTEGLICTDCKGYRQTWAHQWTIDGSWNPNRSSTMRPALDPSSSDMPFSQTESEVAVAMLEAVLNEAV